MSRDNDPMDELANQIDNLEGSAGLAPHEAHDVGDVPVDPNPSAEALGYESSNLGVHITKDGFAMMRGPAPQLCGGQIIKMGGDSFIEDLSDWA